MQGGSLTELVMKISEDYDIPCAELLERYKMYLGSTSKGTCKRGRKKKDVTSSSAEDYIETEEIEYDGVKYLADADGNIYSFDLDSPTLIGCMASDRSNIQFIQ